jgi:Fic family protein
VMIAGSQHLPPQPYLLQNLMDDYFIFYKTQKNNLHIVALAAQMHERLVTIHPFIDGNGRTSRLVMNLFLLQQGFPLAIIGGDYDSRMAYYDALETAQTQEGKVAFVLFIANKVLDGLNRYMAILGST